MIYLGKLHINLLQTNFRIISVKIKITIKYEKRFVFLHRKKDEKDVIFPRWIFILNKHHKIFKY